MSRLIAYDSSALLAMLAQYNTDIWPLHILTLLLSSLALWLVFNSSNVGNKIIVTLLVSSCLWIGIVYQGMYYTMLDWAGFLYAIIFIIQAGLIAWYGGIKSQFQFHYASHRYVIAGIAISAFVIVITPLIDYLILNAWQSVNVTLLTPDASITLLLGLLLTSSQRIPKRLLLIPFVWTLFSIMWLYQLAIPLHATTALINIIAIALLLVKNYSLNKMA